MEALMAEKDLSRRCKHFWQGISTTDAFQQLIG